MDYKIKQIQDVYNQWIQAVVTAKGDASKVLPLYAPDAYLLATFSDRLRRQGKDELRPYFEMFTVLANLQVETGEMAIRLFDDNTAINTGFYTFSYLKNGQTLSVSARFSFVYRKYSDTWLIVDHHSSVVPK